MRWLLWWRPPVILRACIVNLKHENHAIKGVLWSSHGQWLTFKDCTALVPGQSPETLDGEVVIHRDNVSFLQVLP